MNPPPRRIPDFRDSLSLDLCPPPTKLILRAALLPSLCLGLSLTCNHDRLSLSGPTSAQAQTPDPDPGFVPSSDAVPGQYLVTFAAGAYTPPYDPTPSDPVDPDPQAGSSSSVVSPVPAPADAATVADDVCAQYGATLDRAFENVGSFSCVATESAARATSHDPRVEAVEANQYVYGTSVQANPTWGLDRIDQPDKIVQGGGAPNNQFTYTMTGTNVDAWIVDSGVAPDCDDLGGSTRLIQSYTAYTKLIGSTYVPDYTDYVGHGTAVAGIIGGAQYGVAKGVRFRSVRVLNASNKGDIVSTIAGLNYIRGNLPAGRRSVVNMSLIYYGYSTAKGYGKALKVAIDSLLSKKVVVVVAAGNERYSLTTEKGLPASLTQVITVGATDVNDAIAQYNTQFPGSNYGAVVDVFAPGKDITVGMVFTRSDGTRYYAPSSGWYGTSFASPHVAGVAAQYLEANPTKTAAQVQTWIKINATTGKVVLGTLSNTGTTTRILKTSL